MSKYIKDCENSHAQMTSPLYTAGDNNYCSHCDSYFYVPDNNMVCTLNQTSFTDQIEEDLDITMAKGNVETELMVSRGIVRAISVDSSSVNRRKKVIRTLSVGRGKLKVLTRTVSIQTDRSVVDSSTSMELVPAARNECHCHTPPNTAMGTTHSQR